MMGSSGLLLLGLCLLGFAQSAVATFQSVPELESAMYKPVDGSACVRLLTLSGEIGCGNPDRDKVLAPLFRLESAYDALDQKSSVLLPFSELSAFLNRTLYESELTKKVAGVLVESVSAITENNSAGVSDDDRFPEAEFAPYANRNYAWNPSGYVDKEDFFISPLKHEDVILGAPWFDYLAASIKFHERKISFKFREKDIYINAQESGSTMPHVNDQAFDKSIKSSIFAYMIFVKDSLSDVNETKVDKSGMHESLELSKFLNRFQDVFIDDIPGELPPKHGDDDHAIELLPGSSPPNKPPYRVSQAQQEEIMKQVNELVEKGMGSGIINKRFNFPVYLLSDNSTATLQEAALGNAKKGFKYPINVAEFDVVMQTTKVGTSTSVSCLVGSSCLPLGGYSVWSALPPVKASSSLNKQIVMAIASMDSASFFRDRTLGADSPLSGLLTLLAAVDVLSNIPDPDSWDKQLVIVVFTGEAWGYLGSRQFLYQLSNEGSFVQGLNRSLIHQILEVGSVGQAVDNVFYAHSQNLEASAATLEVLEALQVAASSITSASAAEVQVNKASETNPGVPPSSLMPFLHHNENTSGVVLTEFDSVFMNTNYHSSLDVKGQVNSIASAASLVARTLYLLVTGQSNITATDSDLLTVKTSWIEELTGCLLTCNPGMACDLVKQFITPTQTCPNHYVGVFLGDPTEPPVAENIDDTARFVWNFLANRTASIINGTDTSAIMECTTGCTNSEQVCAGSTVEHKGVCVHSTTRYVPAYSTRLQYAAVGWRVIPAMSGDVMGKADPVYTESYWKVLGVRVFSKESSTFEGWIFISGMGIMVGSFVISLFAKSFFRKRLKHA
ncbi:hypothetical protein L7F22_021245 [Adiantum nelumboides]|nr:hypothetical protein [Adiantum nelumboides]